MIDSGGTCDRLFVLTTLTLAALPSLTPAALDTVSVDGGRISGTVANGVRVFRDICPVLLASQRLTRFAI